MAKQPNPTNERSFPSVETLSRHPGLKNYEAKLSHAVRVRVVKRAIALWRAKIKQGEGMPSETEILASLACRYEKLTQPQLRKVVNGTGVVLHTNLGRAPFGRALLQSMADELSGYCALEFDTTVGERGSRTGTIEAMLGVLCEAETGIVVNNCAAALFLALHVLAQGKEVLISRGELVQIGGGFRIPDILESSGAKLIEVGTTNMTSAKDYAKKISKNTGLILKVHQSNFVISGHTETPALSALAEIARKNKIPLLLDLGSGALDPLPAGIEETSIGDAFHQGADLVCFSGDKLLGGPQAGVILGNTKIVTRLRNAPLYRALRLSKTELYLFENILRTRLSGKSPLTFELLALSAESLKARAEKIAVELPGVVKVVSATSSVGAGSLPGSSIATYALEIRPASSERFALELLKCKPPIAVRREKKKIVIDLRTIFPSEEAYLIESLKRIWETSCSF